MSMRDSNDSHSEYNSDWIRPNIDKWNGFPEHKCRNITHIDHGNAINTLLPESTSSSDENKPPSRGNVKQIQVLPYKSNENRLSPITHTQPHSIESSYDKTRCRASPSKRDVSPAILTDTIKIGAENR